MQSCAFKVLSKSKFNRYNLVSFIGVIASRTKSCVDDYISSNHFVVVGKGRDFLEGGGNCWLWLQTNLAINPAMFLHLTYRSHKHCFFGVLLCTRNWEAFPMFGLAVLLSAVAIVDRETWMRSPLKEQLGKPCHCTHSAVQEKWQRGKPHLQT